jgi:hypothetical protein
MASEDQNQEAVLQSRRMVTGADIRKYCLRGMGHEAFSDWRKREGFVPDLGLGTRELLFDKEMVEEWFARKFQAILRAANPQLGEVKDL